MKQSSKSQSSVPAIDAGQLTRLIQSGVQTADEQRDQTLAQLVELQQARLTMLQLEHDRAVQRDGADSDAAAQAKQAIDQASYLVRTLTVAKKKAEAPLPAKQAGHYAVYGHVQSAHGEPLSGHRVKLFHKNKEIAGVEMTPSDVNGYFHTRISHDHLRTLLDAKERAAADKEDLIAQLVLAARVFDGEDAVVAKPDVELLPELGEHDHLAIRLPAPAKTKRKR